MIVDWRYHAAFTALFAVITALIMKKVTVLPDFDRGLIIPSLTLVYVGCTVTMLVMGGSRVHIGQVPESHYVWLAAFAVTYAFLQYFFWHAVTGAPNPGYVMSFLSSGSVLVLLVSYFLFGSELDLRKVIGVIIVFLGLLLISWPSVAKT